MGNSCDQPQGENRDRAHAQVARKQWAGDELVGQLVRALDDLLDFQGQPRPTPPDELPALVAEGEVRTVAGRRPPDAIEVAGSLIFESLAFDDDLRDAREYLREAWAAEGVTLASSR